MRIKALVLTLLLATFAVGVIAEEVCPCVPLGYVWMATPCDSWNCAASALVMANGDPYVMVLPTTSGIYKWVVVRRVTSGSAGASGDSPFVLERYSNVSEGSSRYSSLQTSAAPMMLTAADGNTLVIYLRGGEPQAPPPQGSR
jgi:hypothetical protein